MKRLLPLAALLLIVLIGMVEKIIQLAKLKRRLDFAYTYQNKFVELINEFTTTSQVNEALYIELTEQVSQMQGDMGDYGIASYIDNLCGIKVNNQQFLVNFLPQIREMSHWSHNSIMQQRFLSSAHTCDDMIIRYTGNLKSQIASVKKNIFNPFANLFDGVKWILSLPASILMWTGIISANRNQKFKDNIIVKAITAIITLVGLLSSTVTIIVGWEQSVDLIMGWINTLQR